MRFREFVSTNIHLDRVIKISVHFSRIPILIHRNRLGRIAILIHVQIVERDQTRVPSVDCGRASRERQVAWVVVICSPRIVRTRIWQTTESRVICNCSGPAPLENRATHCHQTIGAGTNGKLGRGIHAGGVFVVPQDRIIHPCSIRENKYAAAMSVESLVPAECAP